MIIEWNRQTVRWFRAAEEYTGFNRRLADILKQQIPKGCTLCDMGCGAALTDIELASHCRQITVVDRSCDVIGEVREHISRLGIDNISPIAADGRCVEGEWDAVCALFHGGREEFECYLGKAKSVFVFASHIDRYGSFGAADGRGEKHTTSAGIKDYLNGKQISYSYSEYCLEYGQPFASVAEAIEFIRIYTLMTDTSAIERYLDDTLVTTGRGDHPYYLPGVKKFGLFTVKKASEADI